MTEKNGGKRSHLKKIRGCDTGEKEVEVGTLLLNNDKNSVIADKKFLRAIACVSCQGL